MVNYAEDSRLSLKTKGLMAVLLYLEKKGESPNATNAANYTTGKYPTIRSGIRDLIKYGYYSVTRIREECGFSYTYMLKVDVDENIVLGDVEE